MKNIIITLATLCSVIFSNQLTAGGNHRHKYDSTSCLQIEGRVLNVDDNDGECLVELIDKDNKVIDTLILREGKSKFRFVLQKNTYYAIRLSKKGFISKLISINTEMLTESDEIHRFNFETKLLHKAVTKRVNTDMLDFPVAIIHFDYENDCFSYNKEYTDNIKKQLFDKKSY